jgi:two-component system response regulator RegA
MIRDDFSKILVCDDDETFRRRLVRSLRDRGFEVYEAESVSAAQECVRQYQPHGVLVDLRMPGESGLCLVSSIMKHFPTMRVVVLTGFGSIATALEAVRLGAKNYLTKPASLQSIVQAFFPEQLPAPDADKLPSLAQVQEEYVNRVLAEHDGNVSQSAKVLGLARRSLQRRLRNR